MNLIKEFWLYLRTEKKLWLFPVILILLGLGVFLIFVEGSAIAPYIYAIF